MQQAQIPLKVVVVGNPNCGKTSLFNLLTGQNQSIGNWSGVTVGLTKGRLDSCGISNCELIDLPGVYSITPNLHCAEDERLTQDYLANNKPDAILNVIDAKNLERNLYLTLQCLEYSLEHKIPVIVVINRVDLNQSLQHNNFATKLASNLNAPVILISAANGIGIVELREKLSKINNDQQNNNINFIYKLPSQISLAIKNIQEIYSGLSKLAILHLLEGAPAKDRSIQDLIKTAKSNILQQTGFASDILIAKTRYDNIEQILAKINPKDYINPSRPQTLKNSLDYILCNKWLGIPAFMFAMYAMFFFAINIGGAFQDFFEQSSNAIFVDYITTSFANLGFNKWILILTEGFGKGLTTVLTFVPVIGAMFFALAFLEESGYMVRASYVIDRLMRILGLPGKAFVPLIVGFGCNVPAILAARTLDHKRDRILTVMMSPFMSCGARLAIFTVFVAIFFKQKGANIVFLLYLVGIIMAIFTGFLLQKSIFRGKIAPLILEIPDLQLPKFRKLIKQAYFKLKKFVAGAAKLIIPVSIVLSLLSHIEITDNLKFQATSNPENSIIAVLGKQATPLFYPMGIDQDNWPATVGLFTGVFAKEVVIGSLNALYQEQASNLVISDEILIKDLNLNQRLIDSLKTASLSIFENISKLLSAIANPISAKAPSLEFDETVDHILVNKFHGASNALAYLLFVLLYFPCISATFAMSREVNWAWTSFSMVWTTSLAYFVAVGYYQLANITLHPASSITWIVGLLITGILAWSTFMYTVNLKTKRQLPTRISLR